MNRRQFCLSGTSYGATFLGVQGFGNAALGAIPLAHLLATTVHAADTYPNRPVRVIVPYAPGGGPDILVRRLGPKLGDLLGQAIVLENKVGAAGVVAAQYVAQSPADGYTLMMGSSTHLIQKILQPDLKFDPLNGFTPISNMAAAASIMVVLSEVPYKKVEDVIAAGKANPDKFNYSSGGIGTGAHLAAATFISLAGIKATHVPLKGSVEIAGSLMRGETHFAFPTAGTAIPQVKGGRLRALAVTGAQRLRELPEVPTLHEVMGSDLTVQDSWFGFWAPLNTPEDIVRRLHAAISQAQADASIKTAFEAAGNTIAASESPRAFAEFMRRENKKWADIIRIAGVSS